MFHYHQLLEVRGRADVGLLPVPHQRRAAPDPDRHDDHHLQEDLRRPREAVEVSYNGLDWVVREVFWHCGHVRGW